MKLSLRSLLPAFALIFFSYTSFAQSVKAQDLVQFKEEVYDFGKIKQGVPVNHNFEFRNIGNKPVVIESAIASCGCTTPTWPQAPVPKGKTDIIKAGFNAAAPGSFNKQITIKVAGVDEPLQVTIKGEVLDAESYAKFEKTKTK